MEVMIMSTWSKIETSREIRQWIGLAIKAAAGSAIAIAWLNEHPEVKNKIKNALMCKKF